MKKQLVRGLPFFADSCDNQHAFPPLQQNIWAEAVVVGGGIAGALCAYYFTKQNIKTILVEKDKVASCSTAASTSLLQYELDQLIQDLEKDYDLSKILRGYRFAHKGMEELKKLLKDLDDDCEYEARDCFTFTRDKAKIATLRYEYDQRAANGFDVAFIRKDTQNFEFAFEVEAGVYARNGGAVINPVKLTRALVDKAVQMGCEVYEATEVIDYKHTNDSVEVYTAQGNVISCKKVIVATGYDISTFTSKKYCTLSTSYNLVTSPIDVLTGWHGRCLLKTAEDIYTYLRTTVDNRIIIGGGDTRFVPELMEDSIAVKQYSELDRILHEMFPHLNYRIEYRYNGSFGSTDDNLPYIGPDPKSNNIWYCLGYGANGILFSINGARMLANLYHGFVEDDLDLVAIHR